MWEELLEQRDRDEVRIALLLHDTCKQGKTDADAGAYAGDHPVLVRSGLYPNNDGKGMTEEMESAWGRICALIDTHMGPWNTLKDGTVFVDKPQSNAQMLVHMCDYLASRRGIEIEGLDEYKPDWKQDVASEAQVKYIESLASKCKDKLSECGGDITIPKLYGDNKEIIIKKGEASSLIGILKANLE